MPTGQPRVGCLFGITEKETVAGAHFHVIMFDFHAELAPAVLASVPGVISQSVILASILTGTAEEFGAIIGVIEGLATRPVGQLAHGLLSSHVGIGELAA